MSREVMQPTREEMKRRRRHERYKRRKPFEFKRITRETAIYRSEGRCEDCGLSTYNDNIKLEAHHIVPIFIARELELLSATIIKSLANCQVLCTDCHRDLHKNKRHKKHFEPHIKKLMRMDTTPMFANIQ